MSNTIITDQLKEVLSTANITVSSTELDNINSLVERCQGKSLRASAAADLICRDLDIDDVSTYSAIKSALISQGIFKN